MLNGLYVILFTHVAYSFFIVRKQNFFHFILFCCLPGLCSFTTTTITNIIKPNFTFLLTMGFLSNLFPCILYHGSPLLSGSFWLPFQDCCCHFWCPFFYFSGCHVLICCVYVAFHCFPSFLSETILINVSVSYRLMV